MIKRWSLRKSALILPAILAGLTFALPSVYAKGGGMRVVGASGGMGGMSTRSSLGLNVSKTSQFSPQFTMPQFTLPQMGSTGSFASQFSPGTISKTSPFSPQFAPLSGNGQIMGSTNSFAPQFSPGAISKTSPFSPQFAPLSGNGIMGSTNSFAPQFSPRASDAETDEEGNE